LLEISEIKGIKHFITGRLIELERLALRDTHRPDFRIYTGNDLGINMIEYGSDYLLGLATLAPEKFAERDRLWETGDPAYYALSDALQYLGNVAFREPVPAYKHSAAVFCTSLEDSFRSDTSEKSEASGLGGGDTSRLREAAGLLRTDSGESPRRPPRGVLGIDPTPLYFCKCSF